MTKFFILLIFSFYILYSIFYIPIIHAADSTPSADIKSKLEELKKEIASKAAKLKLDVDKKLKDKAYLGKVKTSTPASLTLAAKTGPKIVSLNQDTVFESNIKSKVKFTQKSITEEDYLATLGDIDETGVLIAKKVILLPQPEAVEKTYLWGQILSISDKLMTLRDKDLKSYAVSIANSSSVDVGDFVILTGTLGKNDIFEADFVHVIPNGGFIKPKKIATPSAKLATPSATSKTKASPSPKPGAR